MAKSLILLFLYSLSGFSMLYAQEWTKQDSLHLRKMLNGEEEIILNNDAVNSIRLESLPQLPGSQLKMDNTSPSLRFIETIDIPELPKKKLYLTLRPYSAFTKYNEDPIYGNAPQGSIMRRGVGMSMNFDYERRSVRVGSTALGGVLNQRLTRPEKAFQTAGASIGGLDLMAPFTKKFWRRKVKADAWKTY